MIILVKVLYNDDDDNTKRCNLKLDFTGKP